MFYNLKHAIRPHHETISGTLVKWHLQGGKKSPFKQKLPFHPCSATRSTVPLLPPSRLHQQRLCPSGELKRKEVGQEEGERRCASASGMRREDSAGKYSLTGGLHAARMDSVEKPTTILQSVGGSGGSDRGLGVPPTCRGTMWM